MCIARLAVPYFCFAVAATSTLCWSSRTLSESDSSLNLGVDEDATCGLEQLATEKKSNARMNAERIIRELCHGTNSTPDESASVY